MDNIKVDCQVLVNSTKVIPIESCVIMEEDEMPIDV
jgi:hypothetical protein